MLIIPAIDILDGKLVRLEKGDYKNPKVYSANPIEIAKNFAEHGFKIIHIVDLSGSKDGRINTIEFLRNIKSRLKIDIQFGGGIRHLDDVNKLMDVGVDKIVIGSISISHKDEFERIIRHIGTEKIVAAIDTEDELVKIKGWTENADLNIYDHLNYCMGKYLNRFICTDIQRDGMLSGPNIELYQKIKNKYPVAKIIASGGVRNIEDVRNLNLLNLYGVVIGKAIYENKIKLKELAELAGKENHSMP